MDFEKDLRLARYLVRRYVKAYGELVLEHLEGPDIWDRFRVSHLFPAIPLSGNTMPLSRLFAPTVSYEQRTPI
ncbi:MAG: hypothetical protein M3Q60_22830 [Actinomycetota bacterium]|nr:hypothetical protein [Actinomycetota bacterium]